MRLGDSVTGRELGWSYRWAVRFVGGSHQWAFLGTQVPIWGDTSYHTDDHVGGAPFPEWTCYRRSFTKARGTGQQLARKEAHVQDAEVVVSQAHPLTRCVIWPLRALVSSSAK